jgi:hypothetical protein
LLLADGTLEEVENNRLYVDKLPWDSKGDL